MEIIISLMPMMVCGVLSTLLALSLYDQWDRARFRLLVFTLAATVLYMGHFIYFNHLTAAIPLTDTLYSLTNPAVFPLYLIYIEELTQFRPNRRLQTLILLPALVCGLAVGTLYLMMDPQQTALFIERHLYGNETLTLTALPRWQAFAHILVRVVFALQLPPVLIMGFRRIRQYNQMVDNNYSNTEGKRLMRIRTLMVLFTLATILSFALNVLGRNLFTASVWRLAVPSAAFSLLILLIGHVGLSQHFYIQDVDQDALPQPEPVKLPKVNQELMEKIRKTVTEQQLFLQPNLKISDVANLLHTNRNYIYNAINVEMGISFSDFINQQRIDYAAMLMKQNPEMSINDIILKSGFTSSSAFYRNYKKIKGSTPTENRTRN